MSRSASAGVIESPPRLTLSLALSTGDIESLSTVTAEDDKGTTAAEAGVETPVAVDAEGTDEGSDVYL